jgi:hypothetical protein
MALRTRLKLKLHCIIQKLRRRKPKHKDTSIQNALQAHAGVDVAGQAVGDLQLANSKGLGPCRLLDLPVELLLQILELLLEPTPSHSSEQPYWLPSLRLLVHYRPVSILSTHLASRTCKELCHLVTPLIYRTVNLDLAPTASANTFSSTSGRCLTRARSLVHRLPTVGHFIREVSIRIIKPELWRHALELDMATIVILLGIPQLQTLTITYDRFDLDHSSHSSLLDVIPRLGAVTSIAFKEVDPPKRGPFPDVIFDSCGRHVANHFLTSMITHHGQNLRSIELYGTLNTDRTLFAQLRDHTPNLQSLGVRRSLSHELNPLFREPKLWSCAATLQSLVMMQCTVHAEHIATQLALGTLGSIRHCSLFACGHPTDNQSLQTTATWRGPPLETFRMDHFLGWEVDSLSIISTRVLIVTRVERRHLINLMLKPSAFPQITQVRISSKWKAAELEDLRKAAASRGAEVVADWTRFEDPGSGEFMLLERCPCVDCRQGTVGL